MKIIYVLPTLDRCGPTNVLINLLGSLDGSEVYVISLTAESNINNSIRSDLLLLKATIIDLNYKRLVSYIKGGFAISKIINNINPNVVHTIGFRPDLFVKANASEIKYISTINSDINYDYKSLYGGILGSIMSWLHVKNLNGKIIISCSNATKNSLLKLYNLQSTVIRNGVSLSRYKLADRHLKCSLREQFNVPMDALVFIFVGNFIDRKNPKLAIEAFMKSYAGNSNGILIMLGDGPLLEDCKSLLGISNYDIRFYGKTSSTLEYLSLSDYYISTSLSEGLPTSVMEAMACNLPVILSNISAHSELLFDSVLSNYMFSIDQVDFLVQSLNRIIVDLEIKNISRNILVNHINSEIMAEQYQLLYK